MIRCLVVDDEPLVRERIRTLLAIHKDMEVVGESIDGPSALEAFRQTSPQVVFLDIQMPGLTGLEVAEIWRRDAELPIIVFVTAYDEFAVEAFRLHALDFLMKPIDSQRFNESLDRVRTLVCEPNRDELDRRIEAVLVAYERRQTVKGHIVVRDKERYLLVSTSEIHSLEAAGNYVIVHCGPTNHILRSTLSAVEGRLDPTQFLRVHRSWIVNLAQIQEAHPWTKGTWVLLTRAGQQIPVGYQYRDALERILS